MFGYSLEQKHAMGSGHRGENGNGGVADPLKFEKSFWSHFEPGSETLRVIHRDRTFPL